MNTMKVPTNRPAKSKQNSGFALLFFLLGAPHLYMFFKRRSDRQWAESGKRLAQPGIG